MKKQEDGTKCRVQIQSTSSVPKAEVGEIRIAPPDLVFHKHEEQYRVIRPKFLNIFGIVMSQFSDDKGVMAGLKISITCMESLKTFEALLLSSVSKFVVLTSDSLHMKFDPGGMGRSELDIDDGQKQSRFLIQDDRNLRRHAKSSSSDTRDCMPPKHSNPITMISFTEEKYNRREMVVFDVHIDEVRYQVLNHSLGRLHEEVANINVQAFLSFDPGGIIYSSESWNYVSRLCFHTFIMFVIKMPVDEKASDMLCGKSSMLRTMEILLYIGDNEEQLHHVDLNSEQIPNALSIISKQLFEPSMVFSPNTYDISHLELSSFNGISVEHLQNTSWIMYVQPQGLRLFFHMSLIKEEFTWALSLRQVIEMEDLELNHQACDPKLGRGGKLDNVHHILYVFTIALDRQKTCKHVDDIKATLSDLFNVMDVRIINQDHDHFITVWKQVRLIVHDSNAMSLHLVIGTELNLWKSIWSAFC